MAISAVGFSAQFTKPAIKTLAEDLRDRAIEVSRSARRHSRTSVSLKTLGQKTASQRVRSVVVGARTHAGWYQAVVGDGDRRSPERPLSEVTQP